MSWRRVSRERLCWRVPRARFAEGLVREVDINAPSPIDSKPLRRYDHMVNIGIIVKVDQIVNYFLAHRSAEDVPGPSARN
jgi:hypothetical protein